MASNQITLASVDDLDRAGLREFSRYASTNATVAGLAQLAILRKYYEPTDPWRRWVGVDSLTPSTVYQSPAGVIGSYTTNALPGVFRPHVFLNSGQQFADRSNEQTRTALTRTGIYVPSAQPNMHDAMHAGLYAIGDFVTTVDVINSELEHRVSAVLGSPWTSWKYPSETARTKIAATLSSLAAEDSGQFLAEALVEWSEFGYQSSPLAIAVGATVDRYVTRSHGAVQVLSAMTKRFDACLTLPALEAEELSARAAVLTDEESQQWTKTSGAYWKAVKAGDPVPMPHFEPLNFGRARVVKFYSPENRSHWDQLGPDRQLVPDAFAAGGMDSDLAVLLSMAREDGVIIKRPVGVEPPLSIDETPDDSLQIALKPAAELLQERAQRAIAVGVTIPPSWQFPTPKMDLNGPGLAP